MAALLVAAALGLPAAAPAAVATSARYTLTATYSADEDLHLGTELCMTVVPPGAPIEDETRIGVCSVDDDDTRTSTSYTVRSVRPFEIRRFAGAPPQFQLSTPVTGRFTQVASRSAWARWWIGGLGYRTCTVSGGGTASGAVSGTVSLGGGDPARLVVDVGAGTGPFGTMTSAERCEDEPETSSTEPFGELPRAQALLKRVNLDRVLGRAFTVTDRRTFDGPSPEQRTTARWTLRFTPVKTPSPRERWQVEVRGRDRWSWGVFTSLRAGVLVDWAHRSTIEVQDGRVVSATGRVQVLKETPFSEPPGAFTVTSRTQTPPTFALPQARLQGGTLQLALIKESGSRYRDDFTVQVAGPQVLEQLRTIGVPDPEQTYASLVARGTVADTVVTLVPNSGRLSVPLRPGVYTRETDGFDDRLPCGGAAQQDCFLSRGGEIVTVTRLK